VATRPTSSRVDVEALRAGFRATAERLGARAAVDDVFTRLEAAYGEPHRAYHTLAHIESCLSVLDLVRGDLIRPDETAMALWFHDVVYATHPFAKNEERSSELAYESCLRMRIGEDAADRIRRAILATKRHLAGDDHDTNFLLDVDLSILGSDALAYAMFERDIRHEYGWMSSANMLYRRSRAKLLSGFLKRERIYSHPELHARFEKQARSNLARAVAELEEEWNQSSHAHASDDFVVVTRAAALERFAPWSDLHYVLHVEPGTYRLCFSPFDGGGFDVDADEKTAPDVVARVRSLPGYRPEGETWTSDLPGFVYSRDRSGPIEGPVRMGHAPPRTGGAYRSGST
jgi:predicted metal-dependent HD superfamily phosphohydrolase